MTVLVVAPGSAGDVHPNVGLALALSRSGQRGILLTQFPEQLPATLPNGVRHFNYVPFSRVLPCAAAFVHHGGIGTTAQALAAGSFTGATP
jgi:UDP:flavonoid glycosyltransferase YjiC (YdhE family)